MNAEREMLSYVRFPIILAILVGRHEIGVRTLCPLWMPLCCIIASLYAISISMLMFLLCLFFSLFLGWASLSPFRAYKNMLVFLKERGFYDIAVYDFNIAHPFLDDCIRLGDQCVFGRGCCSILRYTDISKVYQYVFKVNFVESRRELHAVDTQGKVWRLCELRTHSMFQTRKNEQKDQALIEVLNFMLYKNRRIAIGYHP